MAKESEPISPGGDGNPVGSLSEYVSAKLTLRNTVRERERGISTSRTSSKTSFIGID